MKLVVKFLMVAVAVALFTSFCRADVNRTVVELEKVPAPVLGWERLNKCFLYYPQSARLDGVTGVVRVRALVLPDGTVGKTHVESGVRADLDVAAQRCLSKTRWVPARTAEGPVAAWVVIPVRYKLY